MEYSKKGVYISLRHDYRKRHHSLRKIRLGFFLFLLSFLTLDPAALAEGPSAADTTRLQNLLEKVYQTMDENYYMPVSKTVYDGFLQEFTAERLWKLNRKTHKVDDFVQLGAGLLVNKLKDPKDRFTSLVPSEKTKAFKSNAYAVTEDLGIEGKKTADGFVISRVEKHCEAFGKNVRAGDILQSIDGQSVASIAEDDIRKKLAPAVGTKVRLQIFFQAAKQASEITLESQSYFKETVSTVPSGKPGVLVIKISHFNQKSSEDFADEVGAFGADKIDHLILDLRDNGGGPPLAAREILGFFLPPNDPLFAIARRKHRPVLLTAPPQTVAYHGPVTVLVNAKTGSAAELFSGLIQAKKIGTLVGQQTAGATYLKSLFDLGDGSTIFMITSLTFFYDRRVYPPDGLTPDTVLPDTEDTLRFALDHLGQK